MSNNGSSVNSTNEGSTSQKTLVESADTFETSLVSMYSQIMANTDTRGMDANIAPIIELRLETSEIATISSVVITIFSA